MKKKPTNQPGKRPQSWIITALLATVAVAYVWFVFLPCQRVINERRAQVQERRQQIMQAQALNGLAPRPPIEAERQVASDAVAQARRGTPDPMIVTRPFAN